MPSGFQRHRCAALWSFALAICSFLSGCATRPDPIPHYARLDPPDAIDRIRQRTRTLSNVRGEADITLTNAKGESVSLDAAYVLAKPDRARLRAWKFGQAVFDLTLDGDRAWAYLPRDEAKSAAPQLRGSLGRWLKLLIGNDAAYDGETRVDGSNLVITRPMPDSTTLETTIDRQTLTTRRLRVWSDDLIERFRLDLSDYRIAGDGQIWPMTIRAQSATGTFVVRSHDVETNTEIDPLAFKPPARAQALP